METKGRSQFPDGKPLMIVWLLILAAYALLFRNGFVSWDDEVYILRNPLVQSLTAGNATRILTRSFEGHYHPLTLFSLAFDYRLSGADPLFFHLHNLLLHGLNASLVYLIVRQMTGKRLTSLVTAVLFGIHPLQVEAVAWATARKDVLYTLYFLGSLFAYQRYSVTGKKPVYFISLLLAMGSVLAKGQGVFLPFCLLLLDYYRGKPLLRFSTWKNKIPFFALALAFGITALAVQRETGYMGDRESYGSAGVMLVTAGISWIFYLFRLLFPVWLSAYYPAPSPEGWYLVLGIAGLLSLALALYFLTRWYRERPLLFFGGMFFLVNLFIFLRWIPVSNYITADRYTYVASVGLFLLVADGLERLKLFRPGRNLHLIVLVPLLLACGILTFNRVRVWRDSLTLVDDILARNPDVYPALNVRAVERMKAGDLDAAQADLDRAVMLQPLSDRAWANRGLLHSLRGHCREAVADYTRALHLTPDLPRVLANRARCHNQTGEYRKAADDMGKAISLGMEDAGSYAELGISLYHLHDFRAAIRQLDRALSLDPSNLKAHTYKGYACYNTGDYQEALVSLDRAIALDPGNPLAFAMRGLARVQAGRKEEACADFSRAESMGLPQAAKEREKYCP